MSSRNRVIWSDGLFVKPHHFQQQTRFFENLVRESSGSDNPHIYGFKSLTINQSNLNLGKISLIEASGIMPDGTLFSIPMDDAQPEPLEIRSDTIANEVIYLCLPLYVEGGSELHDVNADNRTAGRYMTHQEEVRDNAGVGGELTTINVARVRPKLMLGSEDMSAYNKLALTKILGVRSDQALIIDENYLPTMLSVNASIYLRRFVGELADGLRQRATAIANRIGSPGQDGVADVSDFMLLELLNRNEPLTRHYDRMADLHPRELYEVLIQIAGELATFMSESRVASEFPVYDHDTPYHCFPTVIETLKQYLGTMLEPNAVSIPIHKKKYGYSLAPISNQNILDGCSFILAVKARTSLSRLQREFPAQVKVGSLEKIKDLVSRQLMGIPLIPLPVAPRQLPYHAGYSYFQLDANSDTWQTIKGSTGFAFHVAGEFPELHMQFWAIKKNEGSV